MSRRGGKIEDVHRLKLPIVRMILPVRKMIVKRKIQTHVVIKNIHNQLLSFVHLYIILYLMYFAQDLGGKKQIVIRIGI